MGFKKWIKKELASKASGIPSLGSALKPILGNTASSALANTMKGAINAAVDSPLLMGQSMTALPTAIIAGYTGSQKEQMQKSVLNAESAAKDEATALQKQESDKQLQARIKARQEVIMLRQGMTQKSIFGTGKNQPGILG